MSGKYTPLAEFLQEQQKERFRMSFDEINNYIDGGLPPSAWKHRAWWSNHESMAGARNGWLAGGYKTVDVDMVNKELTFVRLVKKTIAFKPQEMDEVELIINKMDGIDNLRSILKAAERYITGEISETELGRLMRLYWPR